MIITIIKKNGQRETFDGVVEIVKGNEHLTRLHITYYTQSSYLNKHSIRLDEVQGFYFGQVNEDRRTSTRTKVSRQKSSNISCENINGQ